MSLLKKIIKEETLPDSLCSDSSLHPKLSTFPIQAESSIDDNPLPTNPSSVDFVEIEVKNEVIVKEEYNSDDYYCYQCNYSTSDKQILTNHVFTHSFTCNLCSYTTFSNSSLREHRLVHFNIKSEESVIVCYQAKSLLTLPKSCEERISNCETQEKLFKCNFCHYFSNRSANLKRHMYKHSGERPFSCDKCDYMCDDKTSLSRHYTKHTREKRFKCNICDYRSNYPVGLKTHMYKHSGEKPFGCDKCDYRCRQKSTLVQHDRNHTSEKPYKCSFCDYSSSRVGNLKRHIYTHTLWREDSQL
ncbi:hypothetical protein FQR65_LT14211 [Abscondita terminalis]|nr:hypothetical protein FQR65_LT14211 [Abscondita terminalis]